MKTNFRVLVLTVAVLGTVGGGRAAETESYRPMKVIQTFAPVFPRKLLDLGIKEGEAQVMLQIDEKGRLTDQLVTFYTHPAFAESAMYAVKKWSYEPAWLNGEARSATVELTFKYENQGLTVVNLTPGLYVARRSIELMPGAYGYRVATLRELDRIPTPKKVVSPAYPVETAQSPRAADVTVTFYIDEEGRVRMPAVNRLATEGNEAFAAAAINAVSAWEFEPPTAHGRPVLVEARQEFHFNPTLAGPAQP